MDFAYQLILIIGTLTGAVTILIKAYRKSVENMQEMYNKQIEHIRDTAAQEIRIYEEINNTLEAITGLLKMMLVNLSTTQKLQVTTRKDIIRLLEEFEQIKSESSKHLESQSNINLLLNEIKNYEKKLLIYSEKYKEESQKISRDELEKYLEGKDITLIDDDIEKKVSKCETNNKREVSLKDTRRLKPRDEN